jgi:hypothetical protein
MTMSDYGETRAKLINAFQDAEDYPSGSFGWETFLIDRISMLEKVAEAALGDLLERDDPYTFEIETALRAAGYLQEKGNE